MSDLISRQSAISICDNAIDLWNGQLGTGALVAVRDAIMALPSAQQWIPCSERLPGEDESFYVLCCDMHGEVMIGHAFACDDGETPYSAESENEYMYDCIAWMPLPAPWKGEQE